MNDNSKKIRELSKKLKDEQSKESVSVERIEDWDAIESLLILNVLDYNLRETLLLGFAALNLVNAFANQCRKENKEHPKLNFHYRLHLRRLMRAYVKLAGQYQDGSMKFHYDCAKETLFVSIYDFQFSFQHERHSVLFDWVDCKSLSFDGIKKQPKAKLIVDSFLDFFDYASYTEAGEPLVDFLESEKQHPENYRFSRGNCYKINSLSYGNKSEVPHKDKNRPELKAMDHSLSIFHAVYRGPISTGDRLDFSDLYPLVAGSKVDIKATDHVNIWREDVEKYYGEKNLALGKKYYIIAKCLSYKEEEAVRGMEPKTEKKKEESLRRWALSLGELPPNFKEPIFPATKDELYRVNALYPDVFDILERKTGDKYRAQRQKRLRIS